MSRASLKIVLRRIKTIILRYLKDRSVPETMSVQLKNPTKLVAVIA